MAPTLKADGVLPGVPVHALLFELPAAAKTAMPAFATLLIAASKD